MSPSLRFLGLVVAGWFAVRAATLGYVPGAELFAIGESKAETPPPAIAQTHFPALDAPVFGPAEAPPMLPAALQVPVAVPSYFRVPVAWPMRRRLRPFSRT